MQTYDLVMILVLGGAAIFGFWKGLAWQVASLASLVVSYFVALKFSPQLAPMVSNDPASNKFVAMLMIYAGTSLAIWLAFRVVAGAIDRVKLNEFDRQMGALVGFAKGVLLCIAITFFAVTLLGEAQRQRIVASRSGQYIVQVLDKADSVTPPEIRTVIAPYIQKVKQPLVDPNYQGQDLGALWEQAKQVAPPAGLPNWPTGDGSQSAWPTMPSQPPTTAPQTPAWPISAPTSSDGDRR